MRGFLIIIKCVNGRPLERKFGCVSTEVNKTVLRGYQLREEYLISMLSAKKMTKALQKVGIKVVNYEESKDPKFMDGDVTLENSLNVQLGFDYASLCLVKEDGIDYLLEVEEVHNEADIAARIARFLQTWQP